MDRGGVKFPRFRLSLLPFFSSRPTVKCVYNKDPILKDRENYPGWFALSVVSERRESVKRARGHFVRRHIFVR